MSWVDDQFLNCKRCGKNAGYSSFNFNTVEEHFICTACGTNHSHTLTRNEAGIPILKKTEYVIDGKLSLIETDQYGKIINVIAIVDTVTSETINNWKNRNSNTTISRINSTMDVDMHNYIVGIVNENNTYVQLFGNIDVELKDGKPIIISEKYDYTETYEDGYGVCQICGSNGTAALYSFTKDTTQEELAEFRTQAEKTGGYFTLWNEEKNELIVEFGKLDLYNDCDEECNCQHEHSDECNCDGNCGDTCSREGGCNCHEKESKSHEFEPVDSQGYTMECLNCGKVININEPEVWDNALKEECTNKK